MVFSVSLIFDLFFRDVSRSIFFYPRDFNLYDCFASACDCYINFDCQNFHKINYIREFI